MGRFNVTIKNIDDELLDEQRRNLRQVNKVVESIHLKGIETLLDEISDQIYHQKYNK